MHPRRPSGRPGVAALTRHPLLWALALWSLSHLAPNSDLAQLILFGGFTGMALAALPAFDARARAALPPEAARAYFGATAVLSLRPLADAAWWRGTILRRTKRILLALALWIALLWLHPAVIGVSPLPL